jgi:hypothetical protein
LLSGITVFKTSIFLYFHFQNVFMKNTSCSLCAVALFVWLGASAQRVGIGTSNPLARLAVDSGIMIDQLNLNQGNLTAGAMVFGSDGLVGISRSTVNGSGARNGLAIYTAGTRRMLIDSVGRVGIGTQLPVQRLHVEGNTFVTGNIGVGISVPEYDLHIANSDRIGGYVGINANPDLSYRLKVNGDVYYENTNIGLNVAPSGSYSLYAAGSVRFINDVRVDGVLNPNNALAIGNNTSIEGSLLVGGRGIVRGNNTAQWRLVRTTVGYAGAVAANSDLLGVALAFNLGGATIAGIFVGPIVEAGAGSSNLASLGLIATDISNTGCRFLITNGSSTIANMGTAENPTRWQLTFLVFD